ncbi:MAG: hypothetical protein HPY61_14850 [Methanotrichaceae archaeon]|nr:hypothetical protein [Methanotrichaceae archaeon]
MRNLKRSIVNLNLFQETRIILSIVAMLGISSIILLQTLIYSDAALMGLYILASLILVSLIYIFINYKIYLNFYSIYKLVLYILPLIGISAIIVPQILELSDLSFLGSYISVPLILAPVLYSLVYRFPVESAAFSLESIKIFQIIYLILFLFSMSLLFLFDVRPYYYYATISLMAICILFQILYCRISYVNICLLLTQIIILVLNLIWGVTLKYYLYIGRTDALGHAWFICNLVDQGFVTDIFGIYKQFPLWHILVSQAIIAAHLSISAHKAMFLVSGIIYASMILAVYVISSYILEDRRIAVLSALFVGINSDVIIHGMYSIARSQVSYLEVLLILLLVMKRNMRIASLLIILSVAIVIYHTISTPFILIILIAIFLLETMFKKNGQNNIVDHYFILLVIVLTIAYWMYCAPFHFESLVGTIFASSGTLLGGYQRYSSMNEWFNYLQHSPLIFFSVLGSLFILRDESFSFRAKIFCILGLVLVPIAFPGPTLLLDKFLGEFRLTRFADYSFLFFSMIAAAGFVGSFFRAKKNFKTILVILFSIMVFLSVSNDFIASDNPLVKKQFYTYYFTEEEAKSMDCIAERTTEYVMSDWVAIRYLESSIYSTKERLLQVNDKENRFLRNSNKDIILIREGELLKRPLKLYEPGGSNYTDTLTWPPEQYLYFNNSINLWNDLEGYNEVYSSGTVSAFS